MSQRPDQTEQSEVEHQPRRIFDRRCFLSWLAISTFLIIWISLASGSFNLRSAVFLLILPGALLRSGAIVTAALRLPTFFALDFLLGVVVVSVAIMAWKVFVPLSLWLALAILLVAIVSIPLVFRNHRRQPLSAVGLLSVFVSLVAATGWCQDLLVPTSPIEDGIVFKPWKDFFAHASIVAQNVGDQSLGEIGNYEWKGFPPLIYHYASYSIATCLAKVGRVPAYSAVLGFWSPFGSFLAGLGSYALGRALWSRRAGLAALAAAVLMPDGVMLNIAHPYYGYFWLQHIAPGGLYAVAVAGSALILITKGVREDRRMWILSGVIVGSSVAFFKIHIFAAAFPLLVSFAILAWPGRKPWQWLIPGVCLVSGVILVAVANHFQVGAAVHFDFSGGAWYWSILANRARGTPVESWYRLFTNPGPFASHLPQAIGLLLLNALGIFAVLAPTVWLIALRCNTWQVSEVISVAAVAILLVMTFGLSENTMLGNADELIHRPFVWAYWLVASLTAGRLSSMTAQSRLHLPNWAVATAIIALLLIPARYGSGLQRGKWSGAEVHSHLRVDRGLIDCANYIRSQPPLNAVVQDSKWNEVLPILGALSERPSFAARPEFWIRISKAFRGSPYKEQLRKLHALQQATTIPDLQRTVRDTGLRWYVVHPGDSYPWPTEFRDHPVFESGGYKVYDMQRCFTGGEDTSGQ